MKRPACPTMNGTPYEFLLLSIRVLSLKTMASIEEQVIYESLTLCLNTALIFCRLFIIFGNHSETLLYLIHDFYHTSLIF